MGKWLFALFCGIAAAQENPEIEKRVAGLAHELRCLVCQNQTIADSNAPLAIDLRNQIREQVKRGASDREVIDFMTARWSRLPYDFLDHVSHRIVNEVQGVSRVVYDISGKPPATIEWE